MAEATVARSERGRELTTPLEDIDSDSGDDLETSAKSVDDDVFDVDIDDALRQALTTSQENYAKLSRDFGEVCRLLDQFRGGQNAAHDVVACAIRKEGMQKKLKMAKKALKKAGVKVEAAEKKEAEIKKQLELAPEADTEAVLDRIQEYREGKKINKRKLDEYMELFQRASSEKHEALKDLEVINRRYRNLQLLTAQENQNETRAKQSNTTRKLSLNLKRDQEKMLRDLENQRRDEEEAEMKQSASSVDSGLPAASLPPVKANERCIFCRYKYLKKANSGCMFHPSLFSGRYTGSYECCGDTATSSGCVEVPHVRLVVTKEGRFLSDDVTCMKLK